MTEHKELVDRLRGFVVETKYGKGLLMSLDVADVEEAARVIEEQAAEIARLKKVIELYREAQAASFAASAHD